MKLPGLARRHLPFLEWGTQYKRKTLTNDVTVAVTVTIMLIPQSPAFAIPEKRPAQVGMLSTLYDG